jgi:hypothetical protein
LLVNRWPQIFVAIFARQICDVHTSLVLSSS